MSMFIHMEKMSALGLETICPLCISSIEMVVLQAYRGSANLEDIFVLAVDPGPKRLSLGVRARESVRFQK